MPLRHVSKTLNITFENYWRHLLRDFSDYGNRSKQIGSEPQFGLSQRGNPLIKIEPEFGVSQRGNPFIKIGDFTFHRQRTKGNKARYWCQAARKGCKAAIYTTDNKITKLVAEHNHVAKEATPNLWYLQLEPWEDLVQCVPTRKGHQILYKGYTYVFKSRLQCGAEQWCCSYRQKTATEELPEWVAIYFMKKDENAQRCNICETVINATEKSILLLDHLKTSHAEVIELHKNPDSTVGFRIEFLQLNVLNEESGEQKTQPVILGEVCEGPTEEVVSEKVTALTDISDGDPRDVQYVLIPRKRKYRREHETRKRSWVWKYFDKLSTIIFRCNICNVVLSIKGCNTNNMNRHVRTRHPSIYKTEVGNKGEVEPLLDLGSEVEPPYAVKTEEICASDKDYDDRRIESPEKKANRRSWVWSYFKKLSGTQAQCKLCNRNISHGGNATGNMNRHIKMIHKEVYTIAEPDISKIADENSWVWKVFESDEDEFYSCKICQIKCTKYSSIDKSVLCILKHLKADHGVVSGDQIITSVDCDTEPH